MPSYTTSQLLDTLRSNVEQTLALANTLSQYDNALLNTQPAVGKWSAIQVIEHLNSYNRYYLPEISKALDKGFAQHIPFTPSFRAGWFGNYFTNMMLPKQDGKIANKMNAPKDHRPANTPDSKKVLAEFVKGQNDLLNYLSRTKQTDMGKLRVPISISKFIKLKLGDTFRFLIAHQQRHFIQVNNTLQQVVAN